jgi:hypothetical protein
VLELSPREALRLGHRYIGTEHLVLGMLREGGGLAAQMLIGLGANYARVSEQVVNLLAEREQVGRQAPLVSQGIAEQLADTAELLTQVRLQKEAAFDAGDLEGAAALRDREKQLLADNVRLEYQLTGDGDVQAVIAENLRLHRDADRLGELLRRHARARRQHRPDGLTQRWSFSQIGAAALALPGHPLNGQHGVGVEYHPSVIARDLHEPVNANSDGQQRMLVVIDGPPRVQALHNEPDLSGLAHHRPQQITDNRGVHRATILPLANPAGWPAWTVHELRSLPQRVWMRHLCTYQVMGGASIHPRPRATTATPFWRKSCMTSGGDDDGQRQAGGTAALVQAGC